MDRPDARALAHAMHRALAFCQQGNWAGADEICRAVLAQTPDYFDALHLGGVVAAQLGRSHDAIELLTRALSVDADHAETCNHLGVVLGMLGRNTEALAMYERALALRPDSAIAHYNRGNTLRDLGRDDEALQSYGRAVDTAPGLVPALHNRGDLWLRRGELPQALADYDRAAALAPGQASLHINRSVALYRLERHAEALGSVETALACEPSNADAHFNRGNTLRALNRLEESLASFDRALSLRPGFAEAHHNRGVTLARLRRHADAVSSYDLALAQNPGYADAWTNRGNALRALKRDDEALRSYSRALELEPDAEFLFGNWLHARMAVCDWGDIDRQFDLLERKIERGERASPPFPTLATPCPPATLRRAAEIWVAARHPESFALPPLAKRERSGRLRIGYFAATLHGHATGYLMAELFEHHDRSQVELTAFSFGPDTKDSTRARIAAAFDRFIDVRAQSDRDVAMLSRSLGIDIAVDLMGFTQEARPDIFAHRAAQLQVSYLGYPGTMGAGYIDYLVADRTLVSPAQCPHYSERIVYLPESYQVNDSKRPIADLVMTREAAGLPADGFVFCCFNNSYKLLPSMFDIWMELLRQVEGSVLWLIEDNPWAKGNLRNEATRRGVDPGRLVFAPRVPMSEHLARHRLADLFLDTLPYNAHTTASDALWSGLPVLTCIGETFAGRVAASLLRAVRLPELVTPTPHAYAARALELARNPASLRALRQRLADNGRSTPLFDAARFARHLEAAFRAMHERYQADLEPEDIVVPP